MKYLSILAMTSALILTMTSLDEVFAQDETITDCQSRCGRRTETGQVLGNPQLIADCRDRCMRQYWDKTENQGKKTKKSLFDD